MVDFEQLLYLGAYNVLAENLLSCATYCVAPLPKDKHKRKDLNTKKSLSQCILKYGKILNCVLSLGQMQYF